jgi:epsin
MDLASLKEAAANLTLYDLKAGVRKVQNGMAPQSASCPEAHFTIAVMNYTEMEAKVREATNNEPWVCSPYLIAMPYTKGVDGDNWELGCGNRLY